MYTKDGFHKALEQKLGDDAYLLLANGGHKKLTDLLTAASLTADGNNTKLSITVGGTTKTGSVTVPYASNADKVDGIHANGLLTAASLGASGNSTTISVTVGGTTKSGSVTVPYATNADTVDGYHEGSFFRYRGSIDVNYVDLTTYTSNATNYQNPSNGVWNVSRSGYSAGLITFTGSGSASGLDIYFHYAKGADFKFRRRIDSNRLSGNWETFITSENIGSQSVSYASSAAKWTTARTLTIGSTGKSVDGSANVSWTLAEIGAAAAGHNHDSVYVKKSGDTMTGTLYVSGQPGIQTSAGTGNWNYIRMHNGSNYWDIATKSNSNSGALDFRPGGADNIGPRIDTNGRVQMSNVSNSDNNYSGSAMWIREYHYGGSQSDSWGNAPRLGWHWSGRVAAQIGLASNGWLYEAPLTATNFYRLVCETTSVTWGINITGNAATATNADKVDGIHANGLLTAASLGTSGNSTTISVTVGGTTKTGSVTVPYATNSTSTEYLNNYSTSDPAAGKQDLKVKWFAPIGSTVGGSAGYAGNNYGFPCSNNANGILWLGTHSGNYGGQLGISSNGSIYYRFISAGSFPTTTNGGSWVRLVTSSNYTDYTVTKTGSGASGTWGINVTGSAGSVAWGNVTSKPSSTGSGTQPVYWNGSTFVACTTYANASVNYANTAYQLYDVASVGGGNTSTYLWRRIAFSGERTGNWNDCDALILIKHNYNGGRFGLLKISFRTDNIADGANASASAIWLARSGFASDSVKVALYKVKGKAYADIYLNVGTYPRCTIHALKTSGWTFYSSNESNNSANPVNAYTSIESGATTIHGVAYTSISNSSDGATVSYANSAGSVAWANVTSKPSSTGSATQPVYWNGSTFVACTTYANASVNYATSAGSVAWANVTGKPTTLSGYGITDGLYSIQVSAAQDNVTWAKGIAKTNRRAFIYNTSGTEYSYLFGFSSSNTSSGDVNYGAVLKMGYNDAYLRILRVYQGSWKTTDWEKISAGYADSAGSATTASQVKDAGNNTAITFKYSSGGFTSNPSWLGAWNGYQLTYVSPSVLSVNYANSAGSSGSAKYIYSSSYTATNNTVGGHKAGLVNWMNDVGGGIGAHVIVSESIISQWTNDSATYYASSVYAMIKIGGGYSGSTYGQWLLSGYSTNRVGIIGRTGNNWDSGNIRWIAYTTDIPTNNNQLTNGSGYYSSGSNPYFGHIYLSGYLYMLNSSGTYISTIDRSGSNPIFGYGQGQNATHVYYTGGTVSINAGSSWSSAANGIYITASNNIGIGTNSPSYKLHVSGDSYTTGWSRAGSGFYCEGNGVHYTHSGTYGEIYLSSNNVFNFTTASWSTLYINYGGKMGGTHVTNYIWNGGSSTTYASHKMKAIELFPTSNNNYSEGLRIHAASNSWATIVLCGTDNTGESGTSTNTWGIFNYNGNLYINKNGSSNTLSSRLWGHGNGFTIGGTSRNSANLTVSSWLEITGGTSNAMGYNTINPRITFSEAGSQAVGIVYTDYDSYRASKGLKVMDVDNNDTGNVWLEVQGSCYAPSFYTTSDRTKKTNIESIASIVPIRKFNWKENGSLSYGFIAQELVELGHEELVHGTEGNMTVNYNAALSLSVAKLSNYVEKLENTMKELKDENNNLKSKIEDLYKLIVK